MSRRAALAAAAGLLGLPLALAKEGANRTLLQVLETIEEEAKCPGSFNLQGYGTVELVPTGWKNMSVLDTGVVSPQLGGRAYFADKCKAGHFSNEDYLALTLLGKTISFSTDISGAGCGCNAAFYMTNMHQNMEVSECGDYYCDANNVCGESCAEIDIMEGNMFAFHSTLHSAHDHDGKGVGYGGGSDSSYAGWNGPRQWTAEEYAPNGRCIDTNLPYSVSVSFPTNEQGNLEAMEIVLTQPGKDCPLAATITNYEGNAAMTSALKQGMTPIVSYWSDKGMLWLDGKGKDQKGACQVDHPDQCADSVKFYDFAIKTIDGAVVTKADLKGSEEVISVASPETPSWQQTTGWWQAPAQQTTPAPTTTGWWQAPTTQATTTTGGWWQAPTTPQPWTVADDSQQTTTAGWNQPGFVNVQQCDCSWLGRDSCQDQGGCASACREANGDPKSCEATAAKNAANVQAALAKVKKEESEDTSSLMADTCFKEGGQFTPVNMGGQARSTEVDATACQDRCSRTLGCARFTYWHTDGGCHLHDSKSEWQDGAGSGVITGPASCKADAYCHDFVDEQSCGWTLNHNCPGQIAGSMGLAIDDGSRGFECCCKYEMWKRDTEASKRGIPEAPQEPKDALVLCTASHGHTTGDAVCCGQEGFVKEMSHVCPQERPTCVGLKAHTTWGTCQVTEGWQQCGGVKDGKPWWGPTDCPDGFVCKEWSKDYSQCYKADSGVIMMYSVFDLQSLFRSAGRSPAIVFCAALLCTALTFAGLSLSRRHSRALVPSRSEVGAAAAAAAAMSRSRPSTDALLASELIV